MEFRETVRRRRMVRAYDPERPIDREVIENLLNLAIRAPSAGHTQGREFLVLDDITSRARFWSATAGSQAADSWLRGMRTAPVLILFLSDKDAYLDRYAEADKDWSDRSESRWPIPYWDVDAGMSAMITMLAAEDTGLATCFFGVPPHARDAVLQEFGIPARLRIVGVVSVGFAAPDRRSPSLRRGRRPLSDALHYGSFRG